MYAALYKGKQCWAGDNLEEDWSAGSWEDRGNK